MAFTGNLNFTLGWGSAIKQNITSLGTEGYLAGNVTTASSPSMTQYGNYRGVGVSGGVMSMLRKTADDDWDPPYYTVETTTSPLYFKVFVAPYSTDQFKVYFLCWADHEILDEFYLYVNNSRKYPVDDIPSSYYDENDSYTTAMCFCLGTFRYNEHHATKNLVVKAGLLERYSKNTTTPSSWSISASQISYSATFEVLPVIKVPVPTQIEQNPVFMKINGADNPTTIYYTASFPYSNTSRQIPLTMNVYSGDKGSPWKEIVNGNNSIVLPSFSYSDVNTVSNYAGHLEIMPYWRVGVDTNTSAWSGYSYTLDGDFVMTAGNDGTFFTTQDRGSIANNPSWRYVGYETLKAIMWRDSIVYDPTYDIHYNNDRFIVQLPVTVESKYGTLSGETYAIIRPTVTIESSNKYKLKFNIDRYSGTDSDKDYQKVYLTINGTTRTLSDKSFEMGPYVFNQQNDYGGSTKGKMTIQLGEYWATTSDKTAPTSIAGATTTLTIQPILSVPKITIGQSPQPFQLGTSVSKTISFSVDDKLTGTEYYPTLYYALPDNVLTGNIRVTEDREVTFTNFPNSLEEYCEGYTGLDSSPLRRLLFFSTYRFSFANTSGTTSGIGDNWIVQHEGKFYSVATFTAKTATNWAVSLAVNLDVNNGPRITTSQAAITVDHPHPELLLVNRNDYLTFTFSTEKDASWIRCVGMRVMFEDQVVANQVIGGGQVGPFTTLPYTANKAFTVKGRAIDTLGRLGPEVTIPVKNGTTAINALYTYNYLFPALTVDGYRANSTLNVDEENGTYVKANYHWNTTQLRTYTSSIKIDIEKDIDDTNAGTQTITLSNNAGSNYVSFNNINIDNSYKVIVTLTDAIGNSTTARFYVQSGKVFMDFKAGGKAMGIGMRAENEQQLDIGWDTHIYQDLVVDGDITGPTIDDIYSKIGSTSAAPTTMAASNVTQNISALGSDVQTALTYLKSSVDAKRFHFYTIQQVPLRWQWIVFNAPIVDSNLRFAIGFVGHIGQTSTYIARGTNTFSFSVPITLPGSFKIDSLLLNGLSYRRTTSSGTAPQECITTTNSLVPGTDSTSNCITNNYYTSSNQSILVTASTSSNNYSYYYVSGFVVAILQ